MLEYVKLFLSGATAHINILPVPSIIQLTNYSRDKEAKYFTHLEAEPFILQQFR